MAFGQAGPRVLCHRVEKRGKATGTRREEDFKGIRETQVTVGIIFKLLLLNGLCLIKCSGLVGLRPGLQGSLETRVLQAQRWDGLPDPVLRPRPPTWSLPSRNPQFGGKTHAGLEARPSLEKAREGINWDLAGGWGWGVAG